MFAMEKQETLRASSNYPILLPHHTFSHTWGFHDGSDGKASAFNVGGPGLIPGLGRSSGEGNGNPFQYSCLKNSMYRGASWAMGLQRVRHN